MLRFFLLLVLSFVPLAGEEVYNAAVPYAELPAPKKPKPPKKAFLVLNNPSDSGMFSVFNSVLGALALYDQGKYAGLKVDLNSGRYLDPLKGPNWWEYFFMPISLGKEKKESYSFSLAEYMHLALKDAPSNRYLAYRLIQRYIRLRPEIQQELNIFTSRHFAGHFVIGVHHRGTDKKMEVPTVSYEKTYQMLLQIIYRLSPAERNTLKIYVATDEQPFLDFLETRCPGYLIYSSSVRSDGRKALHSYGTGFYTSPYQMGKEALMDCLLLSQCQILVRPQGSALSRIASCFNPTMKVYDLSGD